MNGEQRVVVERTDSICRDHSSYQGPNLPLRGTYFISACGPILLDGRLRWQLSLLLRRSRTITGSGP